MQDCSEAKKPCKGILKTSSSFDRPGASYRKSAKFDELNVLQTYHPVDKDYGHMKIEEPKTPFNYAVPDDEPRDQLDADLLAEKLRVAANTQTPAFGDDEDDLTDEEFAETEEEKARRIEFERRRKAHYNEFEAVRLARKLIEEELCDEDDEDDIPDESTTKSKASELSEVNQTETVVEERSGHSSSLSGVETARQSDSTPSSSHSVTPARMDVDQQFEGAHPCPGRD